MMIMTRDLKATFLYLQRAVGLKPLSSPCTSNISTLSPFLPPLNNASGPIIPMFVFLLVEDKNDFEQSQQKVHI